MSIILLLFLLEHNITTWIINPSICQHKRIYMYSGTSLIRRQVKVSSVITERFNCIYMYTIYTLHHAIYSSLRSADNILSILYWGWTSTLAMATILMYKGPVIPTGVRKFCILGVRRNGTGLLASRAPANR